MTTNPPADAAKLTILRASLGAWSAVLERARSGERMAADWPDLASDIYHARLLLAAQASQIEALTADKARLDKEVYIPGVWRCAKCDFRLIQSNLNAHDGSVTARDEPGTKCPNDSSPMWRVTYREDAQEGYDRWEEQVHRAIAAEVKAAKMREALLLARPHVLSQARAESMLDGFGQKKRRPIDAILELVDAALDQEARP